MPVPALVVPDDAPLERFLDVGKRNARSTPPRYQRGGGFERVERQPGITPHPLGQLVGRVIADGDLQITETALVVGHRTVDEGTNVGRFERRQSKQARATDERGVDLEEGVLGGGSDQDDRSVLNPRQQAVLLGLGEPVDLVEEQNGPPEPLAESLPSPREDFPHVFDSGRHGRELLEEAVRGGRDEPCQGRLAGSGRAPQDHGRRAAALHHGSKCCPRPNERFLTHHLVQRTGAHPGRQRLGRFAQLLSPGLEQVRHQAPSGSPADSSAARRAARTSGRRSIPSSIS